MRADVLERALADRRRGTIGWVVGLAVYVVLIVSIFPTIRDNESYADAVEDYPDALKELFGGQDGFDLTTGPGFVDVQLFTLVVPLLLAIVAIGYGASTIGGERERGLLELVLAYPVTRRRVAIEKAAGLVATVFLLAFVVALAVGVTGAVVDLGIDSSNLAAASAGVALLTLLFGLVAMAAGAFTGRRGSAVAVATLVFAASVLVDTLAGLVSALEPLEVLSPYYHYVGPAPLLNGWPVANYVVLAALCVAALAATVAILERRDLT